MVELEELFHRLVAKPSDQQLNDEIMAFADSRDAWEALLDMANLHLQESGYDEPATADLLVVIGAWYMRLDHPEYGIAYCDRALDLDPEHQGALDTMLRVYRANEHWKEAASVAERRLELCDDEPTRARLRACLEEARAQLRSRAASKPWWKLW